nr:long chain base biosynthesis protein 1-like [Tanacetum cinerariifolium]
MKEHSVFEVTSKRSSLEKCKLPIRIRLFISTAHTESDLQKAYESLKIIAALALTGQAAVGRAPSEDTCISTESLTLLENCLEEWETIQVNNLRSEEIAATYVSMDIKF